MAECAAVDCTTEHTPYRCSYCGSRHCPSHRLPEKHDCAHLSQTASRSTGTGPRPSWDDPRDAVGGGWTKTGTSNSHEEPAEPIMWAGWLVVIGCILFAMGVLYLLGQFL
jgi:hypothetical protein